MENPSVRPYERTPTLLRRSVALKILSALIEKNGMIFREIHETRGAVKPKTKVYTFRTLRMLRERGLVTRTIQRPFRFSITPKGYEFAMHDRGLDERGR